jgi:hypothetical protein
MTPAKVKAFEEWRKWFQSEKDNQNRTPQPKKDIKDISGTSKF